MQTTLAEIRMFAGNFAPRSWAFCHGQLLPIAQNQALFSLLGTIYGGDGRTSFALPDLRGRLPIGSGTGPGLSPWREGQKKGEEAHILTVNEIPAHSHVHTLDLAMSVGVSTNSANSNEPTDNVLADSGTNLIFAAAGSADEKLGGVTSSGGVTVSNSGGSQYHTNMMPYLSLNYIIATAGVFPSRS